MPHPYASLRGCAFSALRAPSFKGIRFEAPRHLPDRTIQIRFERRSPRTRVIVYYKTERMGEARALDPIANDRKPTPPQPKNPSSQTPDPKPQTPPSP